MERKIKFTPGHDCRRFECAYDSKDCAPGKGGYHGVGGLSITFLVVGDEGAVQLQVLTGWLPECPSHGDAYYMAADLGYHSKIPQYEDQSVISHECEYTGGDCYYDGSGLNAAEPFRILCTHGEEELWKYLEQIYNAHFYDAEWPKDGPPYPKEKRQ